MQHASPILETIIIIFSLVIMQHAHVRRLSTLQYQPLSRDAAKHPFIAACKSVHGLHLGHFLCTTHKPVCYCVWIAACMILRVLATSW